MKDPFLLAPQSSEDTEIDYLFFFKRNLYLSLPSLLPLHSKLQCLHFSSWDTNKEWMVDLPKGEDVRALCLGQGWAAAATSALMLRLFSIGGVQRELFSLPGPVVCMAGHGEQLLIVYHRGRTRVHVCCHTQTDLHTN